MDIKTKKSGIPILDQFQSLVQNKFLSQDQEAVPPSLPIDNIVDDVNITTTGTLIQTNLNAIRGYIVIKIDRDSRIYFVSESRGAVTLASTDDATVASVLFF